MLTLYKILLHTEKTSVYLTNKNRSIDASLGVTAPAETSTHLLTTRMVNESVLQQILSSEGDLPKGNS